MPKFKLNQEVTSKLTGKKGQVIGVAEYVYDEPSVLVYFEGADDSKWVSEKSLDAANPEAKE